MTQAIVSSTVSLLAAVDHLGRSQLPAPQGASLADALDSAHPGVIAAEVSAWFKAGGRSDGLARGLAAWLARRDGAALDPCLPAIADGARAAADAEPHRAALPWIVAAQLAGERLRTPATTAADIGDVVGSCEALGAAVAARQGAEAQAVARAALAAGTDLATLEAWLLRLAATFPGDGGVAAIAVLKLCDLRAAAGDSGLEPLYVQMAGALAQRPEQLAYTRAHAARMAPLLPRLAAMAAAEDPEKQRVFVEPKFRVHLLGNRPDVAWKAMVKALEFGVPHALLAGSVSLAAAERILRFDPQHELDESVVEGWADAGHLLVLASAVRQLRQRLPAAEWLGLLLFAAGLVQAAGELDAPESEREPLPEPEALHQTWDHGPEIAKIVAFLGAGQSQRAMAVLRGYLLLVLPEQPLCRQLLEAALAAPIGDPLQAAQAIALMAAAIDEFHALAQHPDRALPLCAALRVLPAPRLAGQRYRLALAALDGGVQRHLVGAGPN